MKNCDYMMEKKTKMKNCDMCGSEIIDQKCSCGIWKTTEEMQEDSMKKAIEQFHQMRRFTMTGDAPHLGCAVVFFRGDYNDCKKVEEFICGMKNRPHYKE